MSRSLQEAIAEDLIENEFCCQRDLKRVGKFPWSCDDVKHGGRVIFDGEKFAVLSEEVGEVAREINEGRGRADRKKLLTELVQVATVALGWIEAIRYHEENAEEPKRTPPSRLNVAGGVVRKKRKAKRGRK